MNMYKLIVGSAWVLAIFHVILYSIYLLALSAGIAGLPIGDEHLGYGMTVLGITFINALLVGCLWISQNYNCIQLADGYHKGTEVFFCLLVILDALGSLYLYFLQFLPAFSS